MEAIEHQRPSIGKSESAVKRTDVDPPGLCTGRRNYMNGLTCLAECPMAIRIAVAREPLQRHSGWAGSPPVNCSGYD